MTGSERPTGTNWARGLELLALAGAGSVCTEARFLDDL